MQKFIDKAVLETAEQMLGKHKLRAVIKSTFQVLNRDLLQIFELKIGDDTEQIANKIHQANGPCAIFGATVLSDWLSDLENNLRSNIPYLAAEKIDYIRTLAQLTERELFFQTGNLFQRNWHFLFGR